MPSPQTMSSPQSSPPFESRYPSLSIPEHGFVSSIPAHLLDGCDDQMRWLLQEVSKNTAATEFACRGVVDLSTHLRALNGKTYRNERGLGEAREILNELNEKATVMEPLFKPMSQFMSLWEYKWFRWICYLAGFFLITYVLPAYLAHPVSITALFGQ